MELTVGWILTGISVAGFAGCLAALLLTRRIFRKQRERLLEEIGGE